MNEERRVGGARGGRVSWETRAKGCEEGHAKYHEQKCESDEAELRGGLEIETVRVAYVGGDRPLLRGIRRR